MSTDARSAATATTVEAGTVDPAAVSAIAADAAPAVVDDDTALAKLRGLVDVTAIARLLLALAGATFLLITLTVRLGGAVTGLYAERGRDLLSEVRASFYRKLFLAFVAAAVVPVLTLAFVAQAYMTARLRADVEDAALADSRPQLDQRGGVE